MSAIFLRTIILYLLVLLAMRIMGKRQLGELEASELVAAVMISELAAIPLQDSDAPLLSGVIPILALVSLEIIFTFIVLKSVKARRVMCGRPNMIMENGRVLYKEMKKSRISTDELAEELRLLGIFDFAAVKYAILEVSGKLSVMQVTGEAPTAGAGAALPAQELPIIVINDGRILSRNLRILGLDERWLHDRLRERKIGSVKDVFIMTADVGQKIYISLR